MEWKDDGFKEHEEERDSVDVRISKTCEGIENKLLKQIYAMFDKERFIDLIMNFVVFDKGIKKYAGTISILVSSVPSRGLLI